MQYRKIQLFATEACHLCDAALSVINEFNDALYAHDFQLRVVTQDVSLSADLVNRYGPRIPVVRDGQTGQELDWPFDVESLYGFLRLCDDQQN